MKQLRHILLFGLLALTFSCKDEAAIQAAEVKQITQQNNTAFKTISAKWKFAAPQPTPGVAAQIANWQEWKLYIKEITGKPQAGLQGYRAHAKEMALRAEGLLNNIPPAFASPATRTRISVLITKVRLLYTFMAADSNIPADRVVALIADINRENPQVLAQFDEIVRRSQIRQEQGEQEMIRALDTVRMANPDEMMPPAQNQLPRPSYQTGGQKRNP